MTRTASQLTLSACALALASLAAACHAATPASSGSSATAALPAASVPAAMKALNGSGTEVIRGFSAANGLNGWVLQKGVGESMIVYTTPDGQSLIAGTLFDVAGNNLTAKQAKEYIPVPDFSAYIPDLDAAPAIVAGPTAKADVKATAYVFFDPNCHYCSDTYKEFKPYQDGGLQIRWIPVAILGPTSTPKIEALLTAAKPADALQTAEMNFPQGVTPADKVSDSTRKLLAANLALMTKLGGNGTPLVMYHSDGKLMRLTGRPAPADVPAIAGVAPK